MCRACPTVGDRERRVTPTAVTPDRREHAVSEYVIWFDDYDEERDRCRVGGKNASLATMIAAGLPVPPGFAVTTDAYDLLRTHDDLRAAIDAALAEVDFSDPARLRRISATVRGLIDDVDLPADVERSIRACYADLSRRCGLDAVPVAVRSSATAEDLPDASFAGQQDTYLWVTGADAVIDHVRRCWSSVFTDRAIAYRHEMGHDHEVISMSVGVQKMVEPRCAGVAFTLNPRNGDRSQVAVDASWGFGESVAAGEVTPDSFLVDKVLRIVVDRIVSSKTIEYRLDGAGVVKCDVDEARRDVPCITDEEICAVAAMARRAERHYGQPQDIEWAIDRHLPAGDNVILLQARPETVWARRPTRPIAHEPYDPMRSIVSTLIAPTHATET